MRKLILIVSMSLIGIASIGFLIIQFYFEEKIKNFDQAAIGKIDKQKEIRFCMEKANEAITFSILLETIGSKNDQKTRENIIGKEKEALVNTLNACLINQTIEKKLKDIEKINDTKMLRTEYVKYMKMAGESTHVLDVDRKNLIKSSQKTKKTKNILWYILFLMNSLGIILGIMAISFPEKG